MLLVCLFIFFQQNHVTISSYISSAEREMGQFPPTVSARESPSVLCSEGNRAKEGITNKPESVLLNAETFNWFASHKSSSSTSGKHIPFCNSFATVLKHIKYTLWSAIFQVWSVEHLGILVLSFPLKYLLLQHYFFRSRKTGKMFFLKAVSRTRNTGQSGQVKRWVHFQGPQTGLFPG